MAGEPAADRLTFARPSGGRFQIGPEALAVIRRHLQHESHQPEAGGVLLGRHIAGTSDIIVDRATAPMPGDRQSRHRFIRARRRHQQLIDRAWRESGGTCTYLGEWHSHPERVPVPSAVDRLDWRRKLLVDRFSRYLFFIIAGTEEVLAWEGHRRRTRLWPLTIDHCTSGGGNDEHRG